MVQFVTFGELRVERDGLPLQMPTQKARDLLAYLLIFRERAHPRQVLAGILWPDLPEGKARRRLSDILWRLRHALGDYVMADDTRIWFNTQLPYWLDAEQFHHTVSSLHTETVGTTNHSRAASRRQIEDALGLYQGPFLEGLYQDWVLAERETLRGLYLEALLSLLKGYKQAGDYTPALEVARQLVAAEPLHEAAHQELIRLYHLLGRNAEAVAQYQRCREMLEEELNVAPAPETEALFQELSLHTAPSHGTPDVHLPAPARRPVLDLDQLPLVGRDAERSALLNHLEAAASGQGGVVLLEGEPGIGKTRLAQEVIAGASWRNIKVILIRADAEAAHSYGSLLAGLASSLPPLRVHQLARIVEPVHLQAVAPLLPAVAQAQPRLPALAELPPAEARQRVQRALVALVLGLAQIVPHLWVLEDLQWADAETLSLLSLLIPRLTESRTLFLLTCRSAELRANPVAWEALQTLDRSTPFPRYTLTRLDADAVGRLVHYVLNEDNLTLRNHLAEEGEGVPLYIVETLKTWRDEETMLPDERGGWHWQGDTPSRSPIPLGEAVIGHRLSLLSPTAEGVLATAAVSGVEVDFDLLSHACVLSSAAPGLAGPDHYRVATDDLLRLGFLIETDVGYRFSHEQVRRAVYQGLGARHRQTLHRALTQALEELFPGEFELLAHHFVAADEREPAISYLTRAAERARGLFAHEATLDSLGHLLDLLTYPEDRSARFDALCNRAEVLGWVGAREAQGRDLQEMLDLARALSDDAQLATVLYRRSEYHRLQGRYKHANEDASGALEIYTRLGDNNGHANALTQLGRNLLYTEDWLQGETYFQEALPIHETVGDLEGQIKCLMGMTSIAQYKGDHSIELAHCERGLALARSTGSPYWISYLLSSVGLSYIDLGDVDAAEPYLREALDLAEASGDRRRQAIASVRLAYVANERDDTETAERMLQPALVTFHEMQDAHWEASTLGTLGEVALLQNDPAAAKKHLEVAIQRYEEIGEHDGAAMDLSYLALAELALGDEDAAWQHSREVAAKAKAEWSGPEAVPEVYHNHFRVAEATRHWAAARTAIEDAVNVVNERAELISDPAWRRKFRTGLRVYRAIAEANALQPPLGCLRVRLARTYARTDRRPTPEETVTVIWTVGAGEADDTFAEQGGKVALRRHRILSLLAEAAEAGAAATVSDLAGALDVSTRTIDGDLADLRRQGHPARTRGHRG